VFVDDCAELVELLRGTTTPEMCRATAKLTMEYFEDVTKKVRAKIGARQVGQTVATPKKRKDKGFQESPAKKVRKV
jgi:hypothetical protein